jgi:hypothetical protein
MSFDIFLQCFRDGEPTSFKREIFEAIFLPHCQNVGAYKRDPSFLRVDYPGGSGSDIYCGKDADISCLTFNHGGGEPLFRSMYELAKQTKSVIYWPGDTPCAVVTEEATRIDLPEDFPDKDAAPVVRSGADIIKVIESS